jgi:hypothetical protein
MQLFRNEVFSAPTSFFVLASLRQEVRFACLAAASPDTAAEAPEDEAADAVADEATAGAAGATGVGGAAGASPEPSAIAHRLRDKTAATAATLAISLALMDARIASMNCRTDEARMKLA